MTIKTIPGNLRAVAQLEEGTFQHWDELSRDQIADPLLREQSYWVADYPQYGRNDSGEPKLYLARLDNNLVLKHLFDAKDSSWEQLLNQRTGYFFHPAQDEAQAVIEASSTLPVPLRALRLRGNDTKYRFLQVRTEDSFINTSTNPEKPHFERPIDEEQQLLDRAGYSSAFLNTWRTSRWRIQASNLYLLNPEAVHQVAAEGFVGGAAWHGSFDGSASSSAVDHVVNIRGVLRGVRRVVVP